MIFRLKPAICDRPASIQCLPINRVSLQPAPGTEIHVNPIQGGDPPIYSVLRSSSSVKMKVKGQPPKIAGSQKSNWLLAGQESTSSFT